MTDDQAQLRRAELNAQTGKIPFRELQRFFAAGQVLHVADRLDLVEVGDALGRDDVEAVRRWKDAGELIPVSDESARAWIASDDSVWALAVAPFVLVQAISS